MMEGGTESSYHIVFPGSDADECAGSEMGCELFGGGQFMPSDVCGDLDDDEEAVMLDATARRSGGVEAATAGDDGAGADGGDTAYQLFVR